MKRLFIIFFLTSINLCAQVKKDSISSIDSLTKIELKKKIKLLQTKLDAIVKDEKKEEVEKTWSVKGKVNFVFNQTSFLPKLIVIWVLCNLSPKEIITKIFFSNIF